MKLYASVRNEERGRFVHEDGGLPELEHFPLNGGLEQLSRIRDSDFLHHVCPVRLDGLHADLEPLSNFLILEASPDQLKNFLFACRQGFRTPFARGKNRLG